MKWPEQFEIINEKISSAIGKTASISAISQFLGVSRGKVQAWSKGQRPSADDLETIAHKLNISPVWLLMGETPGYESLHEKDIAIAESADGQIVGDLLWGIFQKHHIDIEEAAKAMGVSFEELDACIGRAPAPSWKMLQKLAAYGININFLLDGKGQDYFPQTEIERAMLAVGARDTWDMASKLGVRPKELDRHLALAKKEGRVMPREWHDILHEKYGLNPGWTMSGKYPSHHERHVPQPTPPGYGSRLTARETSFHEPPAQYPEGSAEDDQMVSLQGDACGIDQDPPTPREQFMVPGRDRKLRAQDTKSNK